MIRLALILAAAGIAAIAIAALSYAAGMGTLWWILR